MGQLNKFANAPGSITDLSSGGPAYPLVYPLDAESVAVGKVWAREIEDTVKDKETLSMEFLLILISMIKNR